MKNACCGLLPEARRPPRGALHGADGLDDDGHGCGQVQDHDSCTGESNAPAAVEQVLAERLAREEVDIDEYEARLSALRRTSELV